VRCYHQDAPTQLTKYTEKSDLKLISDCETPKELTRESNEDPIIEISNGNDLGKLCVTNKKRNWIIGRIL